MKKKCEEVTDYFFWGTSNVLSLPSIQDGKRDLRAVKLLGIAFQELGL
jgi:hypothetical protein